MFYGYIFDKYKGCATDLLQEYLIPFRFFEEFPILKFLRGWKLNRPTGVDTPYRCAKSHYPVNNIPNVNTGAIFASKHWSKKIIKNKTYQLLNLYFGISFGILTSRNELIREEFKGFFTSVYYFFILVIRCKNWWDVQMYKLSHKTNR